MDNRPTLAICHPSLEAGRSRAAVLWAIAALRNQRDITLITTSQVDLGKLNPIFGTDLSAGDFHLRRAPALPSPAAAAKLGNCRVKRFEQFCRTNTEGFDTLLSVYNPMDFGRPGVHLVGDFAWDDDTRSELFDDTGNPTVWLGSRRFGTTGRDILDGSDLVIANSDQSAEILAERFGLHCAPVLEPPARDPEARPDAFVAGLQSLIERFDRKAQPERAA